MEWFYRDRLCLAFFYSGTDFGYIIFSGTHLHPLFIEEHTSTLFFSEGQTCQKRFFRGQTLEHGISWGTYLPNDILRGQTSEYSFFPGTYLDYFFIRGQTCSLILFWDRLAAVFIRGQTCQKRLLRDRLRDIAFFEGQTLDTTFSGDRLAAV